MKWLSTTWSIYLVALSGVISAQSLQQPLEEVPMSNKGFVLLKNGDIVEGKIVNTSSTRGITQVTILNQQKEKQKFRSDEIEEFLIAINDAVKFQFANERGSSVKKLLSKKQPTALPKDYIIYRNMELKPGNEVLLQLLNPDFDEMFEVYYDPFARKSTALAGEYITWTGDKHRAFFVVKNNTELIKIKKNNYSKTYQQLFGDCDVLREMPKPKFEDLDKHIILYQKNCSGISMR